MLQPVRVASPPRVSGFPCDVVSVSAGRGDADRIPKKLLEPVGSTGTSLSSVAEQRGNRRDGRSSCQSDGCSEGRPHRPPQVDRKGRWSGGGRGGGGGRGPNACAGRNRRLPRRCAVL